MLDRPREFGSTGPVPPLSHAVRFPVLAPVDAFGRLAQMPGAFWLDSSLQRGSDTRYSILGCNPRWVFTARDDRWRIKGSDGRAEEGHTGALVRLEALLDAHSAHVPAGSPALPFFGGAVGWFSYDLSRQFEAVPSIAADDLGTPDIALAWYDAAAVHDHQTDALWLVGTMEHDGTAIQQLAAALRQPVAAPERSAGVASSGSSTATSNLAREAYMARVSAVREGIARGEYYQLNLVQRFTCAMRHRAAAAYLRLRAANPAPFAAYLSLDDWTVLCSSPERFLEVESDGWIRTCPIKGTRPRGRTEQEDAANRHELERSEKERAELLMIVDLLRNDLGRVCIPGSVEVRRLHSLESFATVHHLVGEVVGRLRSGVTRRELLRAVFPGGSITGAPKVSAMHAIEQLEPHRRGIGMGSIGYISAHGRMDLNIAIRSIIAHRGQAYMPVGAGIVWDSDPAAEYAETLAKARALFAALDTEPSHA